MFEDLFAKLMDPNFAVTAAQSMDPTALMNAIQLSTPLTMPDPTVQTPANEFAQFLNPTPMPMGPTGPAPTPAPPKLNLNPQEIAAANSLMPKPQEPKFAPAVAPPSPGSGAKVSFAPFVLPDAATQAPTRRVPGGVSLAQLLYGR